MKKDQLKNGTGRQSYLGQQEETSSSYQENLIKYKDDANMKARDIEHAVEDTKALFEKNLFNTQDELRKLVRQRENAISQFGLTPEKLAQIDRDIEAAERGIIRLEAYLVELF